MSRYILIRPIHLSQKKYKNMHLEQIRSCGHKFLNCTRLEILTHIYFVKLFSLTINTLFIKFNSLKTY